MFRYLVATVFTIFSFTTITVAQERDYVAQGIGLCDELEQVDFILKGFQESIQEGSDRFMFYNSMISPIEGQGYSPVCIFNPNTVELPSKPEYISSYKLIDGSYFHTYKLKYGDDLEYVGYMFTITLPENFEDGELM